MELTTFLQSATGAWFLLALGVIRSGLGERSSDITYVRT
jgi:hypothetical protein